MRKLIIALFALLLAAPATAQQFPTVHDRTVIGRIGTGSGTGPSQEIPFANLGPFIFQTITGDCAVTSPLGVLSITCTKTNGVAFAPSATTDTTNATNIGSGTLGNARLAGTQNTVKGAATSAVETDLAMPSCSASSSLLQWTTNTGFNCATVGATGTLDNLLPNNQWRSWSGLTWVTTQNAAGTAAESIPSCASFTLTTADPLFTCANTQQLKVGDLIIVSNIVSFWGFPSAGYETCVQVACTNGFVTAAKITALNTNTNVTLHSPGFSGVSPTSSIAANLAPITPGDNGVTTSGPDGWTKTASLIVTVDTWGASATPASTVYPGCERPLLVRKGITGVETMQRIVPASQMGTYQGQTETFGAAVYQRVQGGASTWNLAITDSTGTTSGTNGTGAGLGGYQFLPVTRAIAQTATSNQETLSFNGNSGDVFDVCLPTAAFVASMVQSQLHTNSFEKVIADSHYNPPTMTPFIIAFPTANMGGVATTLFGYNTNDMEALSFGTIHNAGHVYAKLEWRTTTTWLGCNIFHGGFVNTTNGALTFGLQAVGQVNNIVFPTSMTPIPLYHVGGTFALYTDCNNSTGVVGVGTWDYTDSDNNGPTSFQ